MQYRKTNPVPALCALFALAATCLIPASLASAETDLSTPKKAAVTFSKAVEAGDMEGVKASSVGTDEDYAAIKSLSEMIGAFKRVQTAMVKYGADAKKFSESPSMSSAFEASQEKVDGDSATLINKDKPDDKHPPTLKKTGDVWKMDLKVMSADPEFAKFKEIAKKAVPALDQFSKDVEAGKYATVDDASAALFQTLSKLGGE